MTSRLLSMRRRDPRPRIIRVFHGFMSIMALVIAGFVGLTVIAAVRRTVTARGPALQRSLMLAITLIVGGGMLVSSRAIWLSARPSADSTMRPLRRIYFVLWVAGVCLMGGLLLLL